MGAPTRRQNDETERLRDHETTRPRDHGTTRQRDNGTTRQRDNGTTGQRDNGTTGQRDNRKTQAFPGILRHSQSCVAVRGSAWLCEAAWRESGADVVPSRSLAGWGCTWRTSPFRRTSLVPQMRRYHVKLSRQAGYFIGIIFFIPKSWTFCSSSSLLSDTKRSLSPGFSCVCPLGTK